MNKIFLIIIFWLSVTLVSGQIVYNPGQSFLAVSSWCGMPTGHIYLHISGGLPPYTGTCNGYVVTTSGNYIHFGFLNPLNSATIVDSAGDTLIITFSGGGINSTSNLIRFEIDDFIFPDKDSSNGSLYVTFYVTPGFGQYLPQFNANFNLLDSTFSVIQTQAPIYHWENYFSDPYINKITSSFHDLPKGNYYISYPICNSPRIITVDSLRELPDIFPTFFTTDACVNSPTAKLKVNLHPEFPISQNLFTTVDSGNINLTSNKYRIQLSSASMPNQIIRDTLMGDSMTTFSSLSAGNYLLRIYVQSNSGSETRLKSSHNIIIGTDTSCSSISGKVFTLQNPNCLMDYNEGALRDVLVELQPGGFSANTDMNGNYQIIVPPGVYSLNQYAPFPIHQNCPDSNTFSINATNAGMAFTVNIEDSIASDPDVAINAWLWRPRPGFDTEIKISYRNIVPKLVLPRVICLIPDPDLTFISSTIPIDSIVNNAYYFTSDTIIGNIEFNFKVYFNVPASIPNGTILNTSVNISPAITEVNLSNNIHYLNSITTGSYDPNDKSAKSGINTNGYITNMIPTEYDIRFQNTGTDTAFNVIIVDSIPIEVNPYSVEILSSSHGYRYEVKPGNVIVFHIENILLPDSTTNESMSHGFISFRVNQHPGNIHGTIIKNKADIYFDFNPPVTTNEVSNIIFDCDSIVSFNKNKNELCPGEVLALSANLLFPMTGSFSVDSVIQLSFDSVNILSQLSGGIHYIQINVSNEFCSRTITDSVLIFSEPFISWNGTELICSPAVTYSWILNGSFIAQADSSVWVPQQNGYYQVIVLDTNGCIAISDSFPFFSVGILTPHYSGPVLHPVPSGNLLEISGTPVFQICKWSILDIQGKISMNGDFTSTGNHIIHLDCLPGGVYILKMEADNTIWHRKFQKL